MKNLFVIIIIITSLASCGNAQNKTAQFPIGYKQHDKNLAVVDFAVWHSEIVFQSLEEVTDAVSGYANDTNEKPDYETGCRGTTGHTETVQVYYIPNKISNESLVKAFFASLDPAQWNRQGNDIGTQYRSIAFNRNEKEKQIILNEIKRLTA